MIPQDISARFDALESRIAIGRLISDYAHAFDDRDEDLLRGLWYEDARLLLGAPFGDFEGLEAILASARQNWAQMPYMHHWMANVVIDLDGGYGSARSAVDVLCTHVDMGPVQISGSYRDRFERRDGVWSFVERAFHLHFLTPLHNWKPIAGDEAEAVRT